MYNKLCLSCSFRKINVTWKYFFQISPRYFYYNSIIIKWIGGKYKSGFTSHLKYTNLKVLKDFCIAYGTLYLTVIHIWLSFLLVLLVVFYLKCLNNPISFAAARMSCLGILETWQFFKGFNLAWVKYNGVLLLPSTHAGSVFSLFILMCF